MNYKNILKKIEEKGHLILVIWETGDDETLVSFYLQEGKKRTLRGMNDLYEYLRWQLIETLNLPNIGEHYHKGEGKIFLDSNNQIVLEFTSKEYKNNSNYWLNPNNELEFWGEQEQLESYNTEYLEKIQLEDKFHIQKHLERLDIKLIGEFDKNFHKRTWVHIQVIQGDKLDLGLEVEAFYYQQIDSFLDTFIQNYQQQNKQPKGIYIEGVIQENHVVQFKLIKNAYRYLNIHNKQQIILTD